MKILFQYYTFDIKISNNIFFGLVLMELRFLFMNGYFWEYFQFSTIYFPFFLIPDTVEVENNDGGKRLLEIVEIKRPPGFKPSQEIFRETTTVTNVSYMYYFIFYVKSNFTKFILIFFIESGNGNSYHNN